MREHEVEEIVERARQGDRSAVTQLARRLQHRIYGMALRMLGAPDEAEDATQEILLRVFTNLASFRGDSALTTWVHRIAVNHLLDTRQRSAPERALSFETFGAQIDAGVRAFDAEDPTPVDHVLRNEVRLSCTHAMIVCLSRDERIAFILGALLELRAPEAAALLEISPEAYRKRLSRAKQRLHVFMEQRCGVYDARNRCRCRRQVPVAIHSGQLDPDRPIYAHLPVVDGSLAGDEARELDDLLDVTEVLCTQPRYAAPGAVVDKVAQILAGGA